MKTLILAATLVAVVGCGSGQLAESASSQQALDAYEQALTDRDELVRKRDEVDAIQVDLIEKMADAAESSTQGADSEFVRRVHEGIAEEREIQRQYAEEFGEKIEAAEKRLAEAKASLDAAQ